MIMLKSSPRRNQRSKGYNKVKHVVQLCVLLGVSIWLVYQITHSHHKKPGFEEPTKINGNEVKLARKYLNPDVGNTPSIRDVNFKDDDDEEEGDKKMDEKEPLEHNQESVVGQMEDVATAEDNASEESNGESKVISEMESDNNKEIVNSEQNQENDDIQEREVSNEIENEGEGEETTEELKIDQPDSVDTHLLDGDDKKIEEAEEQPYQEDGIQSAESEGKDTGNTDAEEKFQIKDADVDANKNHDGVIETQDNAVSNQQAYENVKNNEFTSADGDGDTAGSTETNADTTENATLNEKNSTSEEIAAEQNQHHNEISNNDQLTVQDEPNNDSSNENKDADLNLNANISDEFGGEKQQVDSSETTQETYSTSTNADAAQITDGSDSSSNFVDSGQTEQVDSNNASSDIYNNPDDGQTVDTSASLDAKNNADATQSDSVEAVNKVDESQSENVKAVDSVDAVQIENQNDNAVQNVEATQNESDAGVHGVDERQNKNENAEQYVVATEGESADNLDNQHE